MSAFKEIPAIPFEGPLSKNPLAFKYYDKNEMIHGKPMREWLRFSVCFWHSFRGTGSDPFGSATLTRPWSTSDETSLDKNQLLDHCKARIDAAFEFFTKLGVEYYTFHDRDVSPELETIEETNAFFEILSDYLLIKQKQTKINLLWGTANLFSHPRYANGAATNPDPNVYAFAASQVKQAMSVTHKLGGCGYVFWGGREGYSSLLNTNLEKEMNHLGKFMNMAVDWKKKIGATFQFYIEPKPREPCKHQYDYDAQTAICFLYTHNLQSHFKLNIEPNHTTLAGHEFSHDIKIADALGFLGSIDCNTGDELLGWDTDQFLTDDRKATMIMQTIIKMGGFKTGGLNFDCKVRRESVDLEDMFIAHIGSIDTFAKGLRNAVYIETSGRIPKMISDRYSKWSNLEFAKAIEEGKSSFEVLESVAIKNKNIQMISGKQELFENVFNEELAAASRI